MLQPELTAVATDLTQQALAQGHALWFRVFGQSMWPMLRHGDRVCLQGCRPAEVHIGDIVLVRCGARRMLHRLVSVRRGDTGGFTFQTKGDNRVEVDLPFGEEQLLGRAICRERGRKRVRLTGGVYAVLGRWQARTASTIGRALPRLRGWTASWISWGRRPFRACSGSAPVR